MRHGDEEFWFQAWMRLGVVTAWDVLHPSSAAQRTANLDPAAIGKAIRQVAVNRNPFHNYPIPHTPWAQARET